MEIPVTHSLVIASSQSSPCHLYSDASLRSAGQGVAPGIRLCSHGTAFDAARPSGEEGGGCDRDHEQTRVTAKGA
jgi:hypothetical protein